MIDPRYRMARPVAVLTGILLVAGLASVASALYHSEGLRRGTFPESVLRQALWAVLGVASALAAFRVPPARIAPFSFPLYALGLALLLAVLFWGARVNGATRWFRLGPLSFQPSEFAKLFVILALARFLSWPERARSARGFLLAWFIAGVPMVLIQRQPDLTTALLLAAPAAAMLWVAGTRSRFWIGGFVLGLVGSIALWQAGAIHDYQKSRLVTFALKLGLNAPGPKARVAEREAYQEIQARIAIGSGRILGKGFLAGTQNQLSVIPMSTSDFIFAVVAEEWGFVGALGLLAFHFLLAFQLLSISRRSGDPFGRLFVLGLSTQLSAQVVVNVAMALGLLPVVGIPLPLVSAGGSSLVATMLGLGLAARVSLAGEIEFAKT